VKAVASLVAKRDIGHAIAEKDHEEALLVDLGVASFVENSATSLVIAGIPVVALVTVIVTHLILGDAAAGLALDPDLGLVIAEDEADPSLVPDLANAEADEAIPAPSRDHHLTRGPLPDLAAAPSRQRRRTALVAPALRPDRLLPRREAVEAPLRHVVAAVAARAAVALAVTAAAVPAAALKGRVAAVILPARKVQIMLAAQNTTAAAERDRLNSANNRPVPTKSVAICA